MGFNKIENKGTSVSKINKEKDWRQFPMCSMLKEQEIVDGTER